MTSHYIQAWGDPMIAQTAALEKLWASAYRETQVEAFADAYLAICRHQPNETILCVRLSPL